MDRTRRKPTMLDAVLPTLFDAGTNTTVTVTVPDPPGSTDVAYVRLWSMVDTGTWTWRDDRYNTSGSVRGCAEDPGAASMWPSMIQYGCQSGGQPVCAYDGWQGTITCRLDHVSGSATPVMYAIGRPTGDARHYDLAVMGQDRGANGYCCLVSDADDWIDEVVLIGSPAADHVYLNDLGYDMEPFDNDGSLVCEVRGMAGPDLIFGSTKVDVDYQDYLRGYNGDDWIYGLEGHDLLLGGNHDDELRGGDGWDTLIGKPGSDELRGGDGWDTLCEVDAADLMLGSPAPTTSDWNVLYYAKSATTAEINPSTTVNSDFFTCGHQDHGDGWGGCAGDPEDDPVMLTTPPGACGVDNRMPD